MVWKGGGKEYLAPSLVLLYNEINERAGGRDKRSDGSIGDRAHAARKSDHNPAPDGKGGRVVRALDITDDDGNLVADAVWDADDFDIDGFFEQLRRRRDPRIKYVISDGRMFSSYASGSTPPWTWRHYPGDNPHDRHGHISILPGAENDLRSWFAPQEDVMTPAQEAKLDRVIALFEDQVPKLRARVDELHRKVDALEEDLVNDETMKQHLQAIKLLIADAGLEMPPRPKD